MYAYSFEYICIYINIHIEYIYIYNMCVYIYILHSFNVYTYSSLDTRILMLWLFVWPRQNFGLLFGQGSSGSSFGKKRSA